VESAVSTHNHLFLHPTRIDLPLEIRTYVIRLLNQTLACTVYLQGGLDKSKRGAEISRAFCLAGKQA